jgi:hypothetical protein
LLSDWSPPQLSLHSSPHHHHLPVEIKDPLHIIYDNDIDNDDVILISSTNDKGKKDDLGTASTTSIIDSDDQDDCAIDRKGDAVDDLNENFAPTSSSPEVAIVRRSNRQRHAPCSNYSLGSSRYSGLSDSTFTDVAQAGPSPHPKAYQWIKLVSSLNPSILKVLKLLGSIHLVHLTLLLSHYGMCLQ